MSSLSHRFIAPTNCHACPFSSPCICTEPSLMCAALCADQDKVLGIQEKRPEEPAPSQTQPSSTAQAAPAPNATETAPQEAAGPSLSHPVPIAEHRSLSPDDIPEAPGGSDPLSLGRPIHIFSRAAAAEEEARRGCAASEHLLHVSTQCSRHTC